MTPEQFKEKVQSYYAQVLDGVLSLDDADDAILDTLTAVSECDEEKARDFHQEVWHRYFGN